MMPEDPAYITIRRNSHRTVHGSASGHHGVGGGGRQVLDDGISVLSYSSLEDNYDDDVGSNNKDSHSSSNHGKNSSALVAHSHSHAPSTIDEEESSSDDDAAADDDVDNRHNPPPPSSSSSSPSSSSPAAFPPDFQIDKSNSLIPPYFLCPITKCVMIDPVIDREGNTYERKAILRWLDLEDVSPLSRNPLSYHDLVPNRAVRDGIEKARREAWFQYNKRRDEEEEEREERERREKERKERRKTTRGGEKKSGGKSDGKGTDRDRERERERDGKDGSRDRDAAKDKERDRDGKDGRKKSSSSSRSHKDGSGSGSRDKDRDPLLSSSFKEDKSSRLLLQMQKELEALKRQQLEFQQQQQQQQQQWNQGPTTASSGGKSSSRRKPDAEGISPLDKSDRSSGERSSGTSGHHPTQSQAQSHSQSHRSSKSSKEKSSDPAVMRLPPPPPPRKESSRRLNGALGSSMTGSCNSSTAAAAAAAAANSVATATAGNKSHHSTTAFRPAGDSSIASNTASLTSTTMRRHNGWVVPIGVHKVTCAGPGLVVTVDVHRRSTPVKRIVPNIHGRNGSGPSKSGAAARKSNSFSSGTANVRGKTHGNQHDHNNNNNSSNSVASQDLILPNGSFVDVLMTEIHGGRVRGFIRWEEEVPAGLVGADGSGPGGGQPPGPPGGERGDAIQELTKTTTAKRKSSFFLGKLKSHGHGLGLGSKDHDKDHVKDGTHYGRGGDAQADAHKEGGNGIHGSGKAKHHGGGVATRQYEGWISLCWAGDPESAMEKANELASKSNGELQVGGRQGSGNGTGSSKSSSSSPKKKHSRGSAAIAPSPQEPSPSSSSSSRNLSGGGIAASARDADEDVGPWTTPVPLGVYRINFGSGLPLRETPERDSSLLGMLERGQFAEVVETTVKNDRVRARCILTDGGTATANGTGNGKSVSSGWISLLNVKTGSSGATCVPLGAYVTVSEHGCVVTEGAAESSKLKRTLTRGTCVEVCATRLEENNVVRGLLTSGGYATLISGTGRNDGGSNGRGSGGGKRDLSSESYLMPVPLGTYHILYEAGLPVTSGIDSRSDVVMKLAMNTRVEVVETSVENGRVRGRICHPSHGWISLFEPSCRWAKFVFSQ